VLAVRNNELNLENNKLNVGDDKAHQLEVSEGRDTCGRPGDGM